MHADVSQLLGGCHCRKTCCGVYGQKQPLPTGRRQQTADKKPNDVKPGKPGKLPHLACGVCHRDRLGVDQSEGPSRRCTPKHHGKSSDEHFTAAAAETWARHELSITVTSLDVDSLATGICRLLTNHCLGTVSYTHLTLPTNREV